GGTCTLNGAGSFSHAAESCSDTVTDANSCSATTTGNITEPSAIDISSSHTPIACNGGLSTVTVSASGGTGTLNGAGSFSHAAGTYSYTVTDGNSCSASTLENTYEPSAIDMSPKHTQIACNCG